MCKGIDMLVNAKGLRHNTVAVEYKHTFRKSYLLEVRLRSTNIAKISKHLDCLVLVASVRQRQNYFP
jgi:hypothetical protein